jgi:hypothetical protein
MQEALRRRLVSGLNVEPLYLYRHSKQAVNNRPPTKRVFIGFFFFSVEEPPKITAHIQKNPCLWKRKKKIIGTVVSTQRLLQYFHLSCNYFCDMSRYVYNLLQYFKIAVYLFH